VAPACMAVRLHLRRMRVIRVAADEPDRLEVVVADLRTLVRCPACGYRTRTIMGLVKGWSARVGGHRRSQRCRVLLVDETSLRRRHRDVTVLLNGETGEVLGMVRHRNALALSGFLVEQGQRWCRRVEVGRRRIRNGGMQRGYEVPFSGVRARDAGPGLRRTGRTAPGRPPYLRFGFRYFRRPICDPRLKPAQRIRSTKRQYRQDGGADRYDGSHRLVRGREDRVSLRAPSCVSSLGPGYPGSRPTVRSTVRPGSAASTRNTTCALLSDR
jgi:hypothetical protein